MAKAKDFDRECVDGTGTGLDVLFHPFFTYRTGKVQPSVAVPSAFGPCTVGTMTASAVWLPSIQEAFVVL